MKGWARAAWVLGALASTVLAASCVERPPGTSHGPISCKDGCCVCDPTTRHVVMRGCPSSHACPGGLVCKQAPAPPSRAGSPFSSCPGDTAENLDNCVLPDASEDYSNALIDGLGVRELRVTPADVELPYAVFTWDPPSEAETIVCALFGCAPEFAADGVMVNHDACVIARKVFTAVDDSFYLGDATYAHPDPTSPAPTCDGGSATPKYPRELVTLVVGCWAYSATDVVAASRLQPVPPARTLSFGAFRSQEDSCPPNTDGQTCVLVDGAGLGTCHAGQCLTRCLTDDDCKTAGCAEPDARWVCAPSTLGYLGVCRVTRQAGAGVKPDCPAP